MSRRRKPRLGYVYNDTWIQLVYFRPVEVARLERVRRQIRRTKRRAARRQR